MNCDCDCGCGTDRESQYLRYCTVLARCSDDARKLLAQWRRLTVQRTPQRRELSIDVMCNDFFNKTSTVLAPNESASAATDARRALPASFLVERTFYDVVQGNAALVETNGGGGVRAYLLRVGNVHIGVHVGLQRHHGGASMRRLSHLWDVRIARSPKSERSYATSI
jgi:hypothetical protein